MVKSRKLISSNPANKTSRTAKKSHHVVPSPKGGWNVKKGGAEKASKHFATKEEAIERARTISRKQGSDLYIHRKDGTIQKKAFHGANPHPAKDRATHKK